MHKGVYNLLENFYLFRLDIYSLGILFGYSTKDLKRAIENVYYSIINISDPPISNLDIPSPYSLLPLVIPQKRDKLWAKALILGTMATILGNNYITK